MFDSSSGTIVVTGASGWVGRTVLEHLARLLPKEEFQFRLRAFSSQGGFIRLVDGQTIETQPLSALPSLAYTEGFSFLLHAAFLTPDRFTALGLDSYTAINRSITKLVESAVSSTPAVRVVHFSSGAAACIESNQFLSSASTQLYGALKLEEEKRLQAIASTLVLRIYALSGRHIREPRRYALGDFIAQALLENSLQVQSRSPVVRGYVHAGCLAELAIKWLFSDLVPPVKAVNAVTHEVNLIDLARTVAAVFGGLSVEVRDQSTHDSSIYTARPDRMQTMLKLLHVGVPTLEHQIRDTALADFRS